MLQGRRGVKRSLETTGPIGTASGLQMARSDSNESSVKVAGRSQSASQEEGRQFRYSFQSGGRPHKYWLTLFVTREQIFVVEAGGDEAFFDQEIAPKVEAAIASLKTG